MKMKAAVLYELNKPLVIEELELPEPNFGQVLVKIQATGICHKQIEEIQGHRGSDPFLPHTLGHEGAGVVEAIGPGVTKVKPGNYVALSWIKGSGLQSGTPTYMKGKQKVNAGWITTFQEFTVASENRITKISKDIKPAPAALLGCAVSTGVGAVLNHAKIEAGSTVAVFGAGGVGLNIIQGAALLSALKIIVVDPAKDKEKIAKSFGATHYINPKEGNPIAKIKELTDGKGVDYSFESVGRNETMEQAYEAANQSGLVTLIGVPPSGKKMSIDPFDVFHSGKRLTGCLGGNTYPDRDFPRYIALYKAGKLKIDELITHRYKLDRINEAIDAILAGRVGRAVIEF
ncbi:MAG: zinc-binding dehydrogenase [Candidatus Aenigmarchaeota archaeon]|nr:zinc-binding dehydrogenase [Candidatus Aenigmarchaeota archaeon]